MTEGAGAAPQEPPRLRRPGFPLVVLSVLVSAVFLAFMLAATQGMFVPQVVDLYLVCQYARAFAEGHPFRYNAGELPSTGATSLLYTVVLALPEAVGIRGEGLIAFAIVMGAGFYAASVLLASSVATRLAGSREGLLAGLLVVFGGPVVWSFLYGSDIALFLFLALWLLERWLASADAGVPLWTIPGVLVALARPEGLPIALALAVAWTLRSGRVAAPRLDPRPWLPVGAGLAVLALYRVLTGSWLGTSVEDKSLLGSYGVNQGLAIASEYGVDVVRGLLLGLYPSQVPIGIGRGWASLFFPPLALAFIAVAAIVPPRALRRATAAWLAMVAALFALVTPNVFLGAQFQRYVLWAFPGLLALTAAGLGHATTSAIRDPRRERATFRAVAIVWVALGALATLRFASLYGEFAGDIYRRDVATAQWIRRNLPPGTAMANLATSVEYLTGHRSLNLHGSLRPTSSAATPRSAKRTPSRVCAAAAGVAPALSHHHRHHAGPLPHHARARHRAAPLSLRQLRRRDRDLPDDLRPARSRTGSGAGRDRGA
jgi:4-amino-4-deoxy-L-arabinose transferase-like glycosyltransferase